MAIDQWPVGQVIEVKRNYRGSGGPMDISTPTVVVYKDGSTTEITAGITFAGSFDGRVGLHRLSINTGADAAYTAGSFFQAVVSVGTLESVSMVGEVLYEWMLTTVGAVGDPLASLVPGIYTAGMAGFILGTNLNGTVGSRASQVSVDGVQTDVDNIQTRLPTSLISGRMASDVEAINDNAEAAEDLRHAVASVVRGTAAAGTLSTTQMTTDLTETTDNHYNGRIIIWTSGTLKDQATDVSGYLGSTKRLTFTATTEAPIAGDTFVLV